jgi:hypothetical protein
MTGFGRKAQKLGTIIQINLTEGQLRLMRTRMVNRKYAKKSNDRLAEKCREALEKSYGFEIPVPKCLIKKRNS